MKRNIFITVLIAFLLLTNGYTLLYYKSKERYLEVTRKFEYERKRLRMQTYCMDYFCTVKNMDEINRMYKEQEDPNSYLELKQGMLCDMFSSENKDYLFFPLYNHQGEQTSFILLSAGIDGKQNTFLRPTDTLYVDDWHEKLATYNYKEVEMEYHLEYPREYQFSMWDYWFGKKDYVVMLGYKCP